MDRKDLQTRIRRDGHLKLDRTAYELHSVELFGPKRIIRDHRTKPGQVPPKSEIISVGEQPQGFGKQVVWDSADAGLALVVFINPADHLGVMISGVKATRYRIEYVNDLRQFSSWVSLGALTLTNGLNSVPGATTTNTASRFYRAIWLP